MKKPSSCLNDYPLFQGISNEDLKVLLPCINARLQHLPAGAHCDLSGVNPVLILILSGCLVSAAEKNPSDPKEVIPCGEIIRCSSEGTYLAKNGTLLMKLD